MALVWYTEEHVPLSLSPLNPSVLPFSLEREQFRSFENAFPSSQFFFLKASILAESLLIDLDYIESSDRLFIAEQWDLQWSDLAEVLNLHSHFATWLPRSIAPSAILRQSVHHQQ